MKKVISMLLLVSLIMAGFAGCGIPNKKSDAELREEIKKELEAEKAAEKKEDISKASKVNIKDMDAIYEFIEQDIKGLSREDFNSWEVNYMDITGDGTDEVVLAGADGVEWPHKMQIISGDSGEFKRIQSDIPLHKYENKPELRDGFFVVTGRTGGTGTESTVMSLYIYDGLELINVLPDTEIHYRVSDNGVDEEQIGKIDGKLTDFLFTLIKYDYVTNKETVEKKEHYIYNAGTMSFDIEPIKNRGEKTVVASDLKEGQIIDGRTIDKLIYTEGDEFGIGLNGEFTVTGVISYDEIFWDGFILSVDQDSVLYGATVIKFEFDDEYECIPPAGTFIIDANNLKLLEVKIGSDLISEIKTVRILKYKQSLIIMLIMPSIRHHPCGPVIW